MTSLYQKFNRDDVEVFYTKHLPLPNEEEVSALCDVSLDLLKNPYKNAKAPLLAITSTSSSKSRSYPKLPVVVPSILLYSRNMYDVEYGTSNDFSIIHIHSECEPLRLQAKEVTKSLGIFESVGILSALYSILVLQSVKFINSPKPFRFVLIFSAVLSGVGLASYCSLKHWILSHKSFWAKCVDYMVHEHAIDGKSELFLIRVDMADREKILKSSGNNDVISYFNYLNWYGPRSNLFWSLYTLTAGAWVTVLRSIKS